MSVHHLLLFQVEYFSWKLVSGHNLSDGFHLRWFFSTFFFHLQGQNFGAKHEMITTEMIVTFFFSKK